MPGQEPQPVEPEIRRSKRINPIWIVPIVAILIGVWLVYRHFADLGPLATVTFNTADGIETGKTEIRCRSVKVGLVENVSLADDLDSVKVAIRMDPGTEHLIRKGSRFWVVRPRVSGGSISGLGTIISGAYIDLEPGEGNLLNSKPSFLGLEEPPITPAGVPGLRLILHAERGDRVDVGAPVLFRGNEIGRIDRSIFDTKTETTQLQAFVAEQYTSLVTSNTRFWLENVLELSSGAEGLKVKVPSLSSILAGGVSIGLPKDTPPGEAVSDGKVFTLYSDESAAQESAFKSGGEFLLFFDQSVRGLTVGSYAEFRGLRIGRVKVISFEHVSERNGRRVPVLVELDQRQIDTKFPEEFRQDFRSGIIDSVQNGLRASLKSGNLLTGQLFVDLDYFDDPQPYVVEERGGLLVIPTIESGLPVIEAKVLAVLDKIEQLPIEDPLNNIGIAAKDASNTLKNADETFKAASEALTAIRLVVADDSFSQLPEDIRATLVEMQETLSGISPDSKAYGDLLRTLDELRSTARSFERLAEDLEEKPNSLIFGKPKGTKLIPRAVPVQE